MGKEQQNIFWWFWITENIAFKDQSQLLFFFPLGNWFDLSVILNFPRIVLGLLLLLLLPPIYNIQLAQVEICVGKRPVLAQKPQPNHRRN